MATDLTLPRRQFLGSVLAAPLAVRGFEPAKRYLYVACPGIRDYLEYGGHGLLVFDIDDNHKFVKRIPLAGKDDKGKPRNVKGVCASGKTGRIYIGTTHTLTALDLVSEKILWERTYDGGCDRMAIAPDGQTIYLPSFEGDHWNVVSASDGSVISKIVPKSGAHNTIYGRSGKNAYLAGLRSPLLTIADTAKHAASRTVGPFSAAIRPFTIDGREKTIFTCVNGLLGFEVGDLEKGTKVARVEIPGFKTGPVKRHGCPSHGIGLTPDEAEVWVCDATNQRMHVFSNRKGEFSYFDSIKLRDEPGWIVFSLDGTFAYPSTGEVIDVKSRKIVATLTDETGAAVESEKMVEIQAVDGRPVRAGDQFGLGYVTGV